MLPIFSLLSKVEFDRFYSDINSETVLSALKVSIISSSIIALLAFIFGTPLAFLMSRANRLFGSLIRPLIIVALVFPPTVSGLALIALLGTDSPIGGWLLQTHKFQFAGSLSGVVIAGLFVGAPFMVLVAEACFDQLDRRIEDSARTDGASSWKIFQLVILPQCFPVLLSGMSLTWARALGEFGATMTFAGAFPGKTFTPSMQIYADLKDNIPAAYSLSIFMFLISILIIVAMQRIWVPAVLQRK